MGKCKQRQHAPSGKGGITTCESPVKQKGAPRAKGPTANAKRFQDQPTVPRLFAEIAFGPNVPSTEGHLPSSGSERVTWKKPYWSWSGAATRRPQTMGNRKKERSDGDGLQPTTPTYKRWPPTYERWPQVELQRQKHFMHQSYGLEWVGVIHDHSVPCCTNMMHKTPQDASILA